MKLEKRGGSRHAARLARRLAAYIPRSLTTHILRGRLPAVGKANQFMAATLFCDVSGFSTMATKLAADGPRGAEELNRVLLMTFTAMISAIHNAGGVVSHFHGDAMMVYMPDDDGQAAVRALACAQFMQSLMQGGYSEVAMNRTGGKQSVFQLSMKVGVGYGRCIEVVVGDPDESLEIVVAGAGIDAAVLAEKQAQSGQVIASRTVLEKAGLPAPQAFRPVTEMMPVPYAQSALHWEAYDQQRLWQLAEIAAAFVPDALHARITADNAYFVAEHRPATSIFVRYEGIDYEQEDAGQKLQAYYKWARKVVRRYGKENARVNRILTGDKGSLLHIIFGAPVAPDAPDEAVRCALALQREKPDFITSQQIGVTTGQVFACAVGSQNRREYTIVGDVVNLSSRLTDKCPPGSVLVDSFTAQRAQSRIKFERLPPVELKGVAEPVSLFVAAGEHRAFDRLRARFSQQQRPLLWRNAEKERLRTALDAALKGQSRTIAIHGPTSSEYARLLSIGVNHWLDAGGTAILGVGQQHTTDMPFGLWQNAWRDFFRITPEMDELEQAEAIIARMQRLVPDKQGEEDLAQWGEMLGLPLPVTGWSSVALKAEQRHERLVQLTKTYFQAAAQKRPLLVILEEVHWADHLSLALLYDLIWGLEEDVPLVILLTFTPTLNFTIDSLPDCPAISLNELSASEGKQMVRTLLNDMELPAGLTRHLGLDDDKATVNPLFLEESIIMMLEAGVLRVNGQLHLDEQALAQMAVPDGVHSLLLARFDRISAASRTLLQAASVIGREFDLETLMHTLPEMPAQAAKPLLNELCLARMINPVGQGANPSFLFHDDMIHDVAYQSIPYGRRQRWHTTIANWLIKRNRDNLRPWYPILAYHFSRTDMHERGLEFALVAADDAYRAFAGQDAIKLYTMAEAHLLALDEEDRWGTTVHVLLARAHMLRLVGKIERAQQDAEKALQLALKHKHARQIGAAYNLLARLKCMRGHYGDALELAELIIHGLASKIAADELAHAWTTQAELLTYTGQFDEARASFKKAVALFRRAEDVPGLVRVYTLMGYELSGALGDWSEARRHLVQADQLLGYTAESSPEDRVRLLVGLAQVDFRSGEQKRALRQLQQAEKLINEKGLTWWRPLPLYYRGSILHQQGETRQAHEMYALALAAVEEGGNPQYLPLILLQLAHLAPTKEQEQHNLARCVEAAHRHARHFDRLHCLQVARTLGYVG